MNLDQFILDNHITCTSERVANNPNMPSTDMDHWKVHLRRKGEFMRMPTTMLRDVFFSKGSGHHGAEPTAKEVLECLVSDAHGVDESFEDWCGEFGYDTDSRKAEKTYKACKKSTQKLMQFMAVTIDEPKGSALYQELLGLE